MVEHEKAIEILADAPDGPGTVAYLLARICAALERLADIEATGVEAEVAALEGEGSASSTRLCPHRLSYLACASCAAEHGTDG